MSFLVPKAHRFVCGKCGKPIHPWEDKCYFCGMEINWSDDLKHKYPEPDLYSKIIEKNTSYARWKKRQASRS